MHLLKFAELCSQYQDTDVAVVDVGKLNAAVPQQG